MTKTLRVLFDGKVFHPQDPVELKPDSSYVVTIDRELNGSDTEDNTSEAPYPLTAIGALATDMGVSDLSARHNEYAHGTPRDRATKDETDGQ